ncbi:tumor protein D53 homolog isoform X6 [Daktulosphaira vitifoliae]|uniref:tumor protein D53 homolog isoform X6 n=1 Tax=Daktulosphaira vitifoliae TaxID=58002 RepID=UPI0021A99DAF|nr:tumor protein D53 homolog isoform X6 [Daktulosphaira vitifoliae]
MARDVVVHDVDMPSLEYDDEETAFIGTETPSFDADDAALGSTFVIVDEDTVSDPDDEDSIASFAPSPLKINHSPELPFTSSRTKFLDKIKEHKSYQKLARMMKKKGEEPPVIMSPDSGINELQGLSLEEQEKQKEEWQQELNKVEEEIKTLREVLGSKVKASQELRRKLGYTVWQELTDDVSQSLKNVKESNVYQNVEEKFSQFGKAVVDAPIYQKTESVVKTTAEKATTIFGGIGSGLTSKLGQIKNSESFRSFEEKVGSALENVKTKVSSRSNSMQNFDEILEEETRIANEEKRLREEREAANK